MLLLLPLATISVCSPLLTLCSPLLSISAITRQEPPTGQAGSAITLSFGVGRGRGTYSLHRCSDVGLPLAPQEEVVVVALTTTLTEDMATTGPPLTAKVSLSSI